MGAWIETAYRTPQVNKLVGSHPLWVRGLKHRMLRHILIAIAVAPFVGAWIETLKFTSS